MSKVVYEMFERTQWIIDTFLRTVVTMSHV